MHRTLIAFLFSPAVALFKCQLQDGYLGTYSLNGKPWPCWTEWDVWSYKHNLLLLLTWIRLNGEQSALECCRKILDLLCNTSGDGPGKLEFKKQSPFEGQVAVLEPMIIFYRLIGEPVCGNHPKRTFSSCAGLVVYERLASRS